MRLLLQDLWVTTWPRSRTESAAITPAPRSSGEKSSRSSTRAARRRALLLTCSANIRASFRAECVPAGGQDLGVAGDGTDRGPQLVRSRREEDGLQLVHRPHPVEQVALLGEGLRVGQCRGQDLRGRPERVRSWLSRSRPATTRSLATVRPPRPRTRHRVSPAGTRRAAWTTRGLARATPQAKNWRSPSAVGAPSDRPCRPRAAASSLVSAGSRSARSRLCWATVARAAVVALASCSRDELLLACVWRGCRGAPANRRQRRRRGGSRGRQPRPGRYRGRRRPQGQRPLLDGPGCSFTAYVTWSARSRAGEGLDRPLRSGERDPALRGLSSLNVGLRSSGGDPQPGRVLTALGDRGGRWTRCRRSRPPPAPGPSPRARGRPSPAPGSATSLETPTVVLSAIATCFAPCGGPGGGVGHRGPHRVADWRDGVGSRRPSLALRLQLGMVARDEEHARPPPARRRSPRWRPAPPTSSGPVAARSRLRAPPPSARAGCPSRGTARRSSRPEPSARPSGSCCRSRCAGPGRRSRSRSASSSPVIPEASGSPGRPTSGETGPTSASASAASSAPNTSWPSSRRSVRARSSASRSLSATTMRAMHTSRYRGSSPPAHRTLNRRPLCRNRVKFVGAPQGSRWTNHASQDESPRTGSRLVSTQSIPWNKATMLGGTRCRLPGRPSRVVSGTAPAAICASP